MPSEIKKTSKITHKMPIFHRLAPASGSARHLRSALAERRTSKVIGLAPAAGRRSKFWSFSHDYNDSEGDNDLFLRSLLHGILNLESSPDLES